MLGLKWLDRRLPREHPAALVIGVAGDEPAAAYPSAKRYQAEFRRERQGGSGDGLALDLRWRRPEVGEPPHDLIHRAKARYRLVSVELMTEGPS